MVRAWLLIGTTTACFACRGQVNDQAIRAQVLEQGISDSTFVFGEWTETGGTETHLKLLGQVGDTGSRCFKVMTSTWIWGPGRRATNRILIFSGANRFLGQYDATMISDLPDRLEQGSLLFKPHPGDHCGLRREERVDLTNGMPQTFFLDCKGEFVFY